MKKALCIICTFLFACSSSLETRITRLEQEVAELNARHFTQDSTWIAVQGLSSGDYTTGVIDPIGKFCPECQKQGLKSTVQESPYMTSTALCCPHAWYDEEGNYHYEDPNTVTVYYSCSNGHTWEENQ